MLEPSQSFKSPVSSTCNPPTSASKKHLHMSLSLLMPTILMGKHAHGHHQSPDRTQPNKPSSQTSSSSSSTSSLLARALLFPGRARRSSTVTPQPAKPSASAPVSESQNSNSAPTTPIQPRAHDPKPARARIPAVTSKAMTTAPEKDKSRPHRRKYPTNMRQRH